MGKKIQVQVSGLIDVNDDIILENLNDDEINGITKLVKAVDDIRCSHINVNMKVDDNIIEYDTYNCTDLWTDLRNTIIERHKMSNDITCSEVLDIMNVLEFSNYEEV